MVSPSLLTPLSINSFPCCLLSSDLSAKNDAVLRANRRYSGDLSLYEANDLSLIDGAAMWNPIVLWKVVEGSPPTSRSLLKIVGLTLMGWYQALGRFSAFPFWWLDFFCGFREQSLEDY